MEHKENNIEISDNWKRLKEVIPDIEEYITTGKIKVIRLKEGMKEPLDKDYYNKKVTLEELKQHKGNYGIIVGYNNNKNGFSIAVADVDGLTLKEKHNIPMEKKEEIKQLTKDYIYKSLKEAFPNALIVKTQSKGYHFYLWNEEEVDNVHDVSKSLTFPEDFPIEELRNKPLEKSIEIFTKFKQKQVVLPSAIITKIRNNKGKIIKLDHEREYTIISDVNELTEMGTVNNIHDTVKESLLTKNYGVNEQTTGRRKRKSRSSNKSKNSKKLKKLSNNDIKKVVELVTDKYKIFEVIDGSKHYGALALGGFFSYHITKGSAVKIASGIVKKVPSDLFKNSKGFKNDIIKNYERPIEEKQGLPTLLDYIEDYDSTFNIEGFSEELNSICNKKFRKEKVATITINKIKVPVYLMEDNYNKWLKYEGLLEGINLTLDFNKLIGSFRYSKTGKEVDSFKFKFNNNYFEIVKLRELTEFLKLEEIELPEHFEKLIRRNLNSLDKTATKPKEVPVNDVEIELNEEDPDFIKFGVVEDSYYLQSERKSDKGITYNKEIYKENQLIDIKTYPVANVIIKDVTIILDSLGILEPVYNVTYDNLTFNKEVTVEHLTNKELIEEFIQAKVFYYSTKENVEKVLNAFIIDGTKEGRITTKTEAYLEGFYIVDGKVVENTKLQNLKKYTYEDVAEAILLLNEIMEDRSEEGKANDSTVYRFSLWNPYSYCLKQIGYKTGIYSLILIGKTKGNKTGAITLGRLFYLVIEEENSGSTVSVLGSKLEEDSFCKSFDECYNLLNQPETPDVMKKSTQDKTTRITKNRADNKKSDVFNAFALPVFLLNERMEFKDYIRERYKIRDYTSKSYVTKADRNKFNKKYVPDDLEETKLRKVALIGNEFKKKIVPLIEAKDKRLFKPEELTIEILKEIAEETSKATGKEIDFLPEMYIITEDSTNYSYDISKEVRTLLNTEFKKKNKVINNEYIPRHFKESIKNNDFDFITFNRYVTEETSEKHFLISYSGLTKFVNNHVEETVEIESILDYLGLTDILKEKMKQEHYKKTFEEYIKKQNKIKVEGSKKPKNIKGFYLSTEELINNLFSFNLDFTKDDKTDDKTNKKEAELVENKEK